MVATKRPRSFCSDAVEATGGPQLWRAAFQEPSPGATWNGGWLVAKLAGLLPYSGSFLSGLAPSILGLGFSEGRGVACDRNFWSLVTAIFGRL